MDQRKQALRSWVAEQFQTNPLLAQAGSSAPVLRSLGSDAGFRRYFRLDIATSVPLLAVDAPPETEDTQLFVSLAKYLREQGIKAPMVIADDINQGFLLVEDLDRKRKRLNSS